MQSLSLASYPLVGTIIDDDFNAALSDITGRTPSPLNVGTTYGTAFVFAGGTSYPLKTVTTSGGRALNASTAQAQSSSRINLLTSEQLVTVQAFLASGTTGDKAIGCAVRCDATAQSGYTVYINHSSVNVFRWNAGAATTIGTISKASGYYANASYTITLKATGTTIVFTLSGGRSESLTITGQTLFQTNTYIAFSMRNGINTTDTYLSNGRGEPA